MAKQNGKRPRRTTSAGSHQVNWLWGQQSVLETIHANRWRVYELFVTADVLHQHKNLLKAKQKEGVELETVSAEKLAELANTTEHEGIIARVSKYPYESLEILKSVRTPEPMALATGAALSTVPSINPGGKTQANTTFAVSACGSGASPEASAYGSEKKSVSHVQANTNSGEKPLQPLVVLIDRIQDAFTFASILRCCAASRVTAVIVGQFCQAQVTTQLARASDGAVNHFPIIQSEDLASAAKQLKDIGFQLIAINTASKLDICDTPLDSPTACIVASDTFGLDPKLIELCDHQVRIPALVKATAIPSAVAAGILLYETRRQQR
jgi:tRNA G18 (ribose-2'-O)-methylase SpoU